MKRIILLKRTTRNAVLNDEKLRYHPSLVPAAVRTSATTLCLDPTTHQAARPRRRNTTGYSSHIRHVGNVGNDTEP